MSHKLECPWCGKVAGSYERLARHLLECPDAVGFFGSICTNTRCYCICKKVFAIAGPSVVTTLGEHLKESGGITAHLLAVTLGIEP